MYDFTGFECFLFMEGNHVPIFLQFDFFELLGSVFFWANMCAERT